jgi:methionyl-tRNA formyltransferase
MRIVFAGTGTFAEPSFEALLAAFPGQVVGLLTQPDREIGRRTGASRQTGQGMANIAAAAKIPVAMPANINTPDGLAALASFAPDLMVVAAYGQILKPNVIATPTLGCINVHASLLPKYRGAAPVAHAILAGETESGVTIIRITPGLDSGDMLAQAPLTIDPDETAGMLEARLAPLGASACVEVVRRMHAGPIAGIPQDPAAVTKAPKLTKDMGLIDWHSSARRVANQIRAMHPWPTAYTFLHRPGKEPLRVIVHAIQTHTGHDSSGDISPGMILDDDSIVQVGMNERVRIVTLQPAGKSRMTAAEFARGYTVTAGCRFGPERST